MTDAWRMRHLEKRGGERNIFWRISLWQTPAALFAPFWALSKQITHSGGLKRDFTTQLRLQNKLAPLAPRIIFWHQWRSPHPGKLSCFPRNLIIFPLWVIAIKILINIRRIGDKFLSQSNDLQKLSNLSRWKWFNWQNKYFNLALVCFIYGFINKKTNLKEAFDQKNWLSWSCDVSHVKEKLKHL